MTTIIIKLFIKKLAVILFFIVSGALILVNMAGLKKFITILDTSFGQIAFYLIFVLVLLFEYCSMYNYGKKINLILLNLGFPRLKYYSTVVLLNALTIILAALIVKGIELIKL